ncbi:MAG TPA: phospho-sugar mutase [Lapillicoccus sp.]|uniref:phospho-sugar mutase n=1 Tax=Lapillicoccus sp. TaxID=1909287 RepID=UPI002F92CD98
MTEDDLGSRVRAWVDDDPDPVTARELTSLLAAADEGDLEAAVDLADRFAGTLEFGTAGLRGALGGGPNRMNRAVVLRAAAGLVAYLQTERGIPEPMVVVGFDARYNSDVFARDTAAVVVGAGGRASILPRPLPTPVLAFAIRHLGADAGVMVTASHNPPQDNGYKVYLGDGSQIVPPSDAQIASHIAAVASVRDLPLAEDGWENLGNEVQDAYVERVAALLPPHSPTNVRVVHTSLHGVGDDTVRRVFAAAGLPEPITVATQAVPDPDFPTVSFPNPEEAGAIDAAISVAREVHPDVVIANDPDADRCAAAVLDQGDWRMLRGDELGALLFTASLRRGLAPDAVVACSIVSSRVLSALAASAGLRHEETLTGFKWIARVPGLGYGYEEAIGYCVAPDIVRDKDGVSAALLLAWFTAALAVEGHTLLDVLDEIAVDVGVYATDAFSVRVADLAQIPPVMERLRSAPPRELGAVAVAQVDDLSRGDGGLPPTDGLRWFLADGSRVIVRPSGTESKLKVYLEAVEPVGTPDRLAAARRTAVERLVAMRTAMEGMTRI